MPPHDSAIIDIRERMARVETKVDLILENQTEVKSRVTEVEKNVGSLERNHAKALGFIAALSVGFQILLVYIRSLWN